MLCVVHQQTVHLHCYGLAPDNPAKDYWWGLEFYNASKTLSVDDIIVINESSSVLQNVDVMFAGVAPDRSPVPAIRASPSVPSMINVTIQNVALDATNFTEVRTSTIVYNTAVSNCRGACFLLPHLSWFAIFCTFLPVHTCVAHSLVRALYSQSRGEGSTFSIQVCVWCQWQDHVICSQRQRGPCHMTGC